MGLMGVVMVRALMVVALVTPIGACSLPSASSVGSDASRAQDFVAPATDMPAAVRDVTASEQCSDVGTTPDLVVDLGQDIVVPPDVPATCAQTPAECGQPGNCRDCSGDPAGH